MDSKKMKIAISSLYAGVISTNLSIALAVDMSLVKPIIDNVLGFIQIVGFLVGVVMIIWVGMQYLTSGAGKKAEAKEKLVPILIGALLVAAAPTLAKWLWSAFVTSGSVPTYEL